MLLPARSRRAATVKKTVTLTAGQHELTSAIAWQSATRTDVLFAVEFNIAARWRADDRYSGSRRTPCARKLGRLDSTQSRRRRIDCAGGRVARHRPAVHAGRWAMCGLPIQTVSQSEGVSIVHQCAASCSIGRSLAGTSRNRYRSSFPPPWPTPADRPSDEENSPRITPLPCIMDVLGHCGPHAKGPPIRSSIAFFAAPQGVNLMKQSVRSLSCILIGKLLASRM